MTNLRAITVLGVLVSLLAWSVPVHGEDAPDHWNLGTIGATADLVEGRLVLSAIGSESSAAGTLKEGDVLLRAAGEDLGGDPLQVLGRALDAAEKKGRLELVIERDGAPREVKLRVPKLGSYAGAFTASHAKSKKLIKATCTYLVSTQKGGGVWHSYRDGQKHRGDGITTATVMSAMGLMAVDPKKYKSAIRSARGFALTEVRPAELGPDATSGLHRNWPLAITCLFLAELYGQGGDKAVRRHLDAMLDRLARNQEETGGWSHFPGFSEGPHYKSLSSLTALASTAQGVALATGVEVDAESVRKGLDYLEGCIAENGGLAYSAVNGATGVQCAGRSCGALLAFHIHGRTGPKIECLRSYVLERFTDVLESHPAPLTGVWFAAMLAGRWLVEDDDALAGFQARLTEHLLPFVTLARHPEGYFVAQPSSETRRVGRSQGKSNADRQVHDPY